jgi:hypothetical protein
MLILTLAFIAGESGETAILFEAVSGGKARWMFALVMLSGFTAMVLFALSALLIYSVVMINGIRIMCGKLKRPMMVLLGLLVGAFVIFKYADWKTRDEIARTNIRTERIENANWQVNPCGRGHYICIDW